jgi:outer membrane immunogenic protein
LACEKALEQKFQGFFCNPFGRNKNRDHRVKRANRGTAHPCPSVLFAARRIMKKFLLAGVSILAVGITSASAADIARRPPPPAPVYVEPVFTWTGPYVGINGGYGWGSSDFSGPFTSGAFDASGGLAGGTLGYNYQIGQAVLGLEGDIDASWMKGSAACAGAFTCETKNTWLGTARGRLGYSFGRFMPYVTGGAAFGDIKTSINGLGSADETKVGWTAGAGIEAVLGGPWTAKIEYLHVDLGRGSSVLGTDAKFETDIVRAGINYRF